MIVYAAICWVCIVLIGDTLDVGSYSFNRECKQLCLFTILKLYGLKIISLCKKWAKDSKLILIIYANRLSMRVIGVSW